MTDLIDITARQIDAMKGSRAPGHQVIIDGRSIPRLTMWEEGDEVCLVLDGRLSINVPRDMAHQVAWFAANALALGEGYVSLQAETKDRPFAPQVMALGEVPR